MFNLYIVIPVCPSIWLTLEGKKYQSFSCFLQKSCVSFQLFLCHSITNFGHKIILSNKCVWILRIYCRSYPPNSDAIIWWKLEKITLSRPLAISRYQPHQKPLHHARQRWQPGRPRGVCGIPPGLWPLVHSAIWQTAKLYMYWHLVHTSTALTGWCNRSVCL